MILKKSWFGVFLMTVATVLTGCRNNPIIARVENSVIRFDDVRRLVAPPNAESESFPLLFAELDKAVQQKVDEKLKLLDAYARNLQNDADLLGQIENAEKRKTYQVVIEKKVIDEVISKKMLRKRYEQGSKEIKASHILIKSGTSSRLAKDRARRTLAEIRSRAMNGEDFETLALQFSQDSLSKHLGGDLGFLRWDSNNFGDEFYEELYQMQIGKISRPIESLAGFHLVKVTAIRALHQSSFSAMREQLQRSYFDDKRQELEQRYRAFLESLSRHYAVHFNDATLQFFVDRLNQERRRSPEQQSVGFPNLAVLLSDADKNRDLASYRGHRHTLGNFLAQVEQIPVFRRPMIDSPQKAKEYARQFLDQDLVIRWGFDHHLNNHPVVKQELGAFRRNLLLKKIEKLRIDEKSIPSEEVMLAHYEANKSSYVEPAKYKVQQIVVQDLAKAKMIAGRGKKNENFDQLATQYNELDHSKAQRGNLGYITESQQGIVGRMAAKMKAGQVSDPIKIDLGYAIIKVLDIRPAEGHEYNHVKNQIKIKLGQQLRASSTNDWLQELRKKYRVFVSSDRLRKLATGDEDA